MITFSSSVFAQLTVTTVAAPAGAGGTWTDMLFNFFAEWKWWAAILSVVVLGTSGIFMLGKARLGGVMMIIGGMFLGVFFSRIDHFIQVTQNTESRWEQSTTNSNPFRT
jgi:hypothetical protein